MASLNKLRPANAHHLSVTRTQSGDKSVRRSRIRLRQSRTRRNCETPCMLMRVFFGAQWLQTGMSTIRIKRIECVSSQRSRAVRQQPRYAPGRFRCKSARTLSGEQRRTNGHEPMKKPLQPCRTTIAERVPAQHINLRQQVRQRHRKEHQNRRVLKNQTKGISVCLIRRKIRLIST